MFVGVCRCTLLVAGSQSLKEKRSVIRRVKSVVRERLGVQVAEVAGQDTWQRADLGFAVVATERDGAQGLAEGVLRTIGGIDGGQIAAARIEVVAYGEDWFAQAASEGRAWEEKQSGDGDLSWVPKTWLSEEE